MSSRDFFKVQKGVVLTPQPSPPASPDDGSIYYDSSMNLFQKRENGSWSPLAGSDTTLGLLTNNDSNGNKTVISGTSRFVPFLHILNPDIYTVDAGGQLSSVDSLTVDGTLITNGTVVVL